MRRGEDTEKQDAEQRRRERNVNLPDKGGLNLIESRRVASLSDSGCDSLQLALPPPYTYFLINPQAFCMCPLCFELCQIPPVSRRRISSAVIVLVIFL